MENFKNTLIQRRLMKNKSDPLNLTETLSDLERKSLNNEKKTELIGYARQLLNDNLFQTLHSVKGLLRLRSKVIQQ